MSHLLATVLLIGGVFLLICSWWKLRKSDMVGVVVLSEWTVLAMIGVYGYLAFDYYTVSLTDSFWGIDAMIFGAPIVGLLIVAGLIGSIQELRRPTH